MYKFSLKAICLTLCLSLIPFVSMAESVNITSIEAAKMLETPVDKRVFLDVRTPKEFEAEHINGSEMIDVKGSDFKEKVAKLDRNAPHIVFCVSGNRSGKAVAIMEELGFTNVKHMKDGLNGWKKNNLGNVVSK